MLKGNKLPLEQRASQGQLGDCNGPGEEAGPHNVIDGYVARCRPKSVPWSCCN